MRKWIFVLLAPVVLWAQIGSSGTLKGTVTDSSGAIVPGVVVVATHTLTGVENRRETTASGLFVIAPLAPGNYQLTATANGFRRFIQENIVVDALSTLELSVKLEVGATTESVTITGVQAE